MRQFILLLSLLVVALMTSCSHKTFSPAALNGPNPEQARFENVVRNQYKYEALQSKSKYSLGSASLSGRLCLESGHRLCLQVNAPLLGFEVARVEASQDSIVIVDKYDKKYSVAKLSDLMERYELAGYEMEVLECVMLGRIFIPGKGVATTRDYKLLQWSSERLANGSTGNTQGVYNGKNYTLTYTIDMAGRLVSTLLVIGQRSIRWEYSDYEEVEKGKLVPTRETITAIDADNTTLQLGLGLNNPQLGESTWRDFQPTSSYQRVTMKELVETVKSLAK